MHALTCFHLLNIFAGVMGSILVALKIGTYLALLWSTLTNQTATTHLIYQTENMILFSRLTPLSTLKDMLMR